MAAAIPYVIMAAGTAAQMDASRRQANQQRDVVNNQLRRTADATDKNIQAVQQESQNFDPQARAQAMQGQQAQNYDQTQADLAGAGGSTIGTAGDAGNVSKDFLESKASRAIDEGNRLTSIAREAARTRAPNQLLTADALRRANMTSNLSSLWGGTKNMGAVTQLDAQGVQMGAEGGLGKIASSIGTGMAAGGYGSTSGISWDPDGSYTRKYAAGAGR
jgi:hypothetical protein